MQLRGPVYRFDRELTTFSTRPNKLIYELSHWNSMNDSAHKPHQIVFLIFYHPSYCFVHLVGYHVQVVILQALCFGLGRKLSG